MSSITVYLLDIPAVIPRPRDCHMHVVLNDDHAVYTHTNYSCLALPPPRKAAMCRLFQAGITSLMTLLEPVTTRHALSVLFSTATNGAMRSSLNMLSLRPHRARLQPLSFAPTIPYIFRHGCLPPRVRVRLPVDAQRRSSPASMVSAQEAHQLMARNTMIRRLRIPGAGLEEGKKVTNRQHRHRQSRVTEITDEITAVEGMIIDEAREKIDIDIHQRTVMRKATTSRSHGGGVIGILRLARCALRRLASLIRMR